MFITSGRIRRDREDGGGEAMAQTMRATGGRVVALLSLMMLSMLGVGLSRAAEMPGSAPRPLQVPTCDAGNPSSCFAKMGALTVLHLRRDFYVIIGDGENIGVQVGQEGAVVVNAGTKAGAASLLGIVKPLSPQGIRLVIDTNADAETVGGNAALAAPRAAQGGTGIAPAFFGRAPAADIVANQNVLQRMSQATGVTAYPFAALPNDPFPMELNPYSVFVNGEPIIIFDQPAASSDADSFVLFRHTDVVMAGDVMDMTRFPVIDLAHGGSIDGEIAALTKLQQLTIDPPSPYYDEGTRAIPAHGRVCDEDDVDDYRDMVVIIRDTVAYMMKQHLSLAQIEAQHPAGAYEPLYGATTGPWTTNMFIEAIYKSLRAEKKLL